MTSGFARLFAEKLCFSGCRFSLIRGCAAAYAESIGRAERLLVGDAAAKPQEKRESIGEAQLHRK